MPFAFKSVVITPDAEGLQTLADIEDIIGIDYIKEGRLNVFVWIDRSSLLRIVAVPRRAHRPTCYGEEAGKMLISPGCIDMAGVVITPRKDDYGNLTESLLHRIYSECGEDPQSI